MEGKNDTNVIKSYLNCDTIETHGTHISEQILKQIEMAQEKRGVIIFTDPDFPGEKIRSIINQRVPGCKNAFIDRAKAKTNKKIGVEHASKKDIMEALKQVMTYRMDIQETLPYVDFLELGLQGNHDSAKRREKIAAILHLGKPNAKTLWKRLNMLQQTQKDIGKLLEEKEEFII